VFIAVHVHFDAIALGAAGSVSISVETKSLTTEDTENNSTVLLLSAFFSALVVK